MKRILLIEDEPDVAKTIKLYLEQEGYSVDISLEPSEGLKKLKDYDLLLLDLIMPKLSGRAVLREMKRAGLRMPVVVLTAIGMPLLVKEELSKEHPGLELVPKTSMYSDLLPAIRRASGS